MLEKLENKLHEVKNWLWMWENYHSKGNTLSYSASRVANMEKKRKALEAKIEKIKGHPGVGLQPMKRTWHEPGEPGYNIQGRK